MWGYGDMAPPFLTWALLDVSYQFHVPAALLKEKATGTH
jgi:hypothetical protein